MRSHRLPLLACLAAGLIALMATPAVAENAPQYKSPQGTNANAQGVVIVGYDTNTGLPCLVGNTATCALKTSGGGGGGGAATVADGADMTQGAKADAATCATTNTLIACARQIDADIKGTGSVQGVTASGATVTENPTLDGCRAATASPTAVTDGQKVAKQCTSEGRTVTSPYSVGSLQVRGYVASTDGSAHTILAAAGSGVKNIVTDLECYNTSATTITITVSDSASSVFILPAGGGFMKTFNVPLTTAANTAFTFTASTGVTTAGCAAQGFTGA